MGRSTDVRAFLRRIRREVNNIWDEVICTDNLVFGEEVKGLDTIPEALRVVDEGWLFPRDPKHGETLIRCLFWWNDRLLLGLLTPPNFDPSPALQDH
jgi:hypothetical protein